MRRIPHISALMTAFPRHLGINVGAREARHFMLTHGIRHLPVMADDQKLVGIVHLADLSEDSDALLGELVEPVVQVDAADRADQVLDLMVREHCPVVVVLRQNRLSGIFTWTDACHHFARLLREPFTPPEGDDVA